MEEEYKNLQEAPARRVSGSKTIFSDFMDIIESIIGSVFFVLLIFTFICRPVTVDGSSMNPTLINGDKLIMTNLFYTPKRGDIVIINNEHSYTFTDESQTELAEGAGIRNLSDEGKPKRLIKRVVALGGQKIDIDFEQGIVTVDGKKLSESYISEPTRLDEGAFKYPVTVPEGYIFVMGDNRNNSADSRDGHVGFVKEQDVMGKAVLRFYPFDNVGRVN